MEYVSIYLYIDLFNNVIKTISFRFAITKQLENKDITSIKP